ncbi:MAG TPA: AraC family transcriptional regulator [Anaerovoracaceae bacterium]|nr:AraC family transcriptional regulator [Anaerovoracaceae bacterium]
MYNFSFYHYFQDRIPSNHFHDGFELLLAAADGGKLFIKDTCYDLRKGALYCIKPFELHHCFCHDEEHTERFVFYAPFETLEDMSTSLSDFINVFQDAPRFIMLNVDYLEKFLHFERELKKTENRAFGSDIKRNILFQNLWLQISRLVKNKEYDTIAVQPNDNQRILPILRYIHKNISEDLSLEGLSKEFFLSKSRLNQIFKTSTGFSVGEYIITCRINKACILLKSNMPIQEISSATGFGDPTHFSRTFKKRLGITPSAYHKNSADVLGKKPAEQTNR